MSARTERPVPAVGRERRQVMVRGVVQGVGFRPFVYALALELSLAGEVRNTPAGVVAEVEGAPTDVARFCERLRSDAPALAQVDEVTWQRVEPRPGAAFAIRESAGTGGRTLVPPDVGTCAACLAEMLDPADRRHRHPFVTCTSCGPRFTIVTGLPYDRPLTTMAGFAMCPDCEREYHDPADRRFHAQPVSCHACGPVLELAEPDAGGGLATSRREPALARARELLADGRVVAVKGLGGYHLACDATDAEAVTRLRERKHRGDKPFAVLVADLDAARAIVDVDEAAATLLASPQRPIVLLRRRPDSAVVAQVAPGNPDLGVMLPPTALHHLVLGLPGDPPGPGVLVLTSGNLAGEPIVTEDDDALRRLAGLADAWLRHDRPIHVPCDDSVVRMVDGEELPVRRSRGYAPLPVRLPFDVPPVLAVGGDLKNALCLAQGRHAWLSAHIGDMDDLATQRAFESAVSHLGALVDVTPSVVVADRHPGYRSSRWAVRRRGLAAPPVRVQHHHAHVAAVMAEHGLHGDDPVIGVAFDGTGYGDDGAVWGGEVLLATYSGFRRLIHLGYVPLAGGDVSVLRPYRMALAHLHAAGLPWGDAVPSVAACPAAERDVLAHQLGTGLACVPTSSMGRLFDAVSSLAGVRHVVGYEAQAAIELEALARDRLDGEPGAYDLPLRPIDGEGGPTWRWDPAPLIHGVVADVLDGVPAGVVGARFHRGVAAAVVAAAEAASGVSGVRTVALGGGVFVNTVLLRLATAGLAERGFAVLSAHRVPPTDAGLALGQVVVGARQVGLADDPPVRPSPSRSTPA